MMRNKCVRSQEGKEKKLTKKMKIIPVAYNRSVDQERPNPSTLVYHPIPKFLPNSIVVDRQCTTTMSFFHNQMLPTSHIYIQRDLKVIGVDQRNSLTKNKSFKSWRDHLHGSFWHSHVQAIQNYIWIRFGSVTFMCTAYTNGLLTSRSYCWWLWHKLSASSGQIHAIWIGCFARWRWWRWRCASCFGIDRHFTFYFNAFL